MTYHDKPRFYHEKHLNIITCYEITQSEMSLRLVTNVINCHEISLNATLL